MLRPCHHARIRVRFFCLFLSFYIQSPPTQSRPRYAAPTPPTSPLSHRLPLVPFFSPTPSSPNAATSPTGTNCCTPPYPPPATPSARFSLSHHSERSASHASRMILQSHCSSPPCICRAEKFLRSSLATRHPPLATSHQPIPTPHPASLPQSPSHPPLSPPDKTSPPHTSHSYPSTPPPASPAPPPPQQSPPATPPPAKTNNDYDNVNVRT